MDPKTVRVDITLDANNDPIIQYECNGFVGDSCESIAEIMRQIGQVTDKKVTEDAYRREIPIPVPNQILEG